MLRNVSNKSMGLFLVFIMMILTSSTTNGMFFGRRAKKEYTPLYFFKVPKGQLSASDEMEVRVKEIEKELGVHVERLDVMRDPMARKLYQTIDLDCECKGTLPLLYHRESRQTIYGKCSNPSRIRAWAKGRWLAYSSKYFDNADDATDNVDLTTFLPDDDDDDDGDYNEEYERLQEEAMTDMQRKGKEAMKKRMQQKQQQQQQQQ